MKEPHSIGPGRIIRRKKDGSLEYLRDVLTIEEPLEIQIGGKTLATTMRTPGHDDELAAGFLVSEAIVRDRTAIVKISRDGDNTVMVDVVGIAKLKKTPHNASEQFRAVADCAARRASTRSGKIFQRSSRKMFGSISRRCYRFRKNCERRRAISRAPAEFMPQEFLIQAVN